MEYVSFGVMLIGIIIAIVTFTHVKDISKNVRYLVGTISILFIAGFAYIGFSIWSLTNYPPMQIETSTVVPPSDAFATPANTLAPTTTLESVSTSPSSRCEWLRDNFPQVAEGITVQFGLAVERVRMLHEGCTEISTGFVIELGTEVQMAVPSGGCIDAPLDANFSDATEPDGAGGLRAFSGTVRSVVMTYRPLC